MEPRTFERVGLSEVRFNMNITTTQIAFSLSLAAGLSACAADTHDMNNAVDPGKDTNAVSPSPDPTPTQDNNAPKPSTPAIHKAYIGLFGDSTVGVLDVDAQKIIKTLPVTAPDGLIVSPDGKKVFVSSTDTGTVVVIDTGSDEMSASIDVGPKPAGLSITPDGSLVVAAVGGADEAVIIDAASNAVLRHVTVGQAHASCITADGHYAFVGSQVTTAPAIVQIDLDGDSDAKTFPVDKSPRMLACEKDQIYFTAIGLDAVEVFHPDTGKLDTPIASDGSPHDVRASEPGKTELVVSQTGGDLEFIDVPTATITDKVPTGKMAHWIAVTADRKVAYVTNEGDDNVSMVDLEKRQLVTSFPVGKAPRKMALKP